jgi:tRNA threonylcarbamoyladenosine biosynthesis protein TsaE
LARALALDGAGSGILIGLVGALGAGKTAFVQGFVAALPGGEGLYVTSPTFAIAQRYPTDPPVTHVDLFRIASLAELESIGYREFYFGDEVTIVEWIDRVPEAIPDAWLEIRLAVSHKDAREISLRPHGDRLALAVSRCFDDA